MKLYSEIIEEAYRNYIYVVGEEPEILIIHENALEKLKKETEEKITVVIESDIVTYRGATIKTSKMIHEDRFIFSKHNEQFEIKRVCECWLNEKGHMPWCYCEGQPELE